MATGFIKILNRFAVLRWQTNDDRIREMILGEGPGGIKYLSMRRPHILVTNDDGIHAEGIKHLVRVISEQLTSCRLTIVAPYNECSAVGHAVTAHKPIKILEVSSFDELGITGIAVNGTPVDCVLLAVEELMSERPDLIVSGINNGSNLGTDIFSSGTVAAALEGVILGIPSIAVSMVRNGNIGGYLYTARFVCRLTEIVLQSSIKLACLLNINMPADLTQVKGCRVTSLSKRFRQKPYVKKMDSNQEVCYWLTEGKPNREEPEDRDSDYIAVNEGYISITPVHYQLTDTVSIPVAQGLIKGLHC